MKQKQLTWYYLSASKSYENDKNDKNFHSKKFQRSFVKLINATEEGNSNILVL